MLFPAHAGMILFNLLGMILLHTFPRACGDDPKIIFAILSCDSFSPRMRG